MKNPIVGAGHFILKNQVAYDSYQFCVGGVRYRNRLISKLDTRNMNNFLDLGCGTGVISELLPGNIQYYGVDQSHNYLDKAAQRKPDGFFSLADVCDIKWVDELRIKGATIATALGLLHHLADNQVVQLLKNCKSVLTDDALLFSVDPVITNKSTPIAKWFAQNDRGKFVRSPEHLESLLISSGLNPKITLKSGEFRMPLDTIEISATFN